MKAFEMQLGSIEAFVENWWFCVGEGEVENSFFVMGMAFCNICLSWQVEEDKDN